MMGHGVGLAAQHYAERDATQRSSAPPCGRRYIAVTDGLSSTCSAASAPTMIRCSWLATASSRPSCSAWTGAAELARKLVVGVRQRGWDGDDELADQLDVYLGGGRAAMLRALPVGLDELAGILKGGPLSVGGRIDITTGEVWSQAAIDYVLETGEEDEDTSDDPERWLAVHGAGSREGYRDMELFIASVEDLGRAERLAVAIKGRGAFRRFKGELACWPGELERWHAFSEERQRGRARSWLAAAGYRVLPGPQRPRFLRTAISVLSA